MIWKLGAVLVILSVAGCAAGNQQAGSPLATSAPDLTLQEAKQLVAAERSRIWKDPYSIRDARISQPYSCTGGLAHVANMPNVCVCVEANAPNSFGGYTGLKRNEVLIKGRQVVDVIEAREMTYSCGSMVPFPEISASR